MKKGFTLAEVLITLAIIGVVAAITAPMLNNSVQKAKVGPSIRKFMTNISEANMRILAENESADELSSVTRNLDTYLNLLSKHLSGNINDKNISEIEIKPTNYTGGHKNSPLDGADANIKTQKIFNFDSGDGFAIRLTTNAEKGEELAYKNGSYKGMYAHIWYDINGYNNKPNRTGKDLFLFIVDDNGTVYPDGGKTRLAVQPNRSKSVQWYSNGGWAACNEKNVTYGTFCGASVVDNNYKVIYKY